MTAAPNPDSAEIQNALREVTRRCGVDPGFRKLALTDPAAAIPPGLKFWE